MTDKIKMKAGELYNAVICLAGIINDKRPLSFKGNYRIARMHTKLTVEFTPISKARDDLILSYNHKAIPKDDKGKDIEGATPQDTVPDDKADDFLEKWKAIADEVIEIDAEAIPFEQLDMGDNTAGLITANELIVLGPLVKDPV